MRRNVAPVSSGPRYACAVQARHVTGHIGPHQQCGIVVPKVAPDRMAFVADLAARVMLDGQATADAISAQLAEHWAAKEKGLQAALQGPEVTALLETARFTEKQRSAS